jgi:hypothetical protein
MEMITMNKKILVVIMGVLFLSTAFSLSIASETKTIRKSGIDSMMFCDVLIKGTATEKVIKGNFFLGFGRCLYMKIDLENDGSIDITSLADPTNNVELNGNYQIHLIGFDGFYSSLLKTRVDGKAILAIWG